VLVLNHFNLIVAQTNSPTSIGLNKLSALGLESKIALSTTPLYVSFGRLVSTILLFVKLERTEP